MRASLLFLLLLALAAIVWQGGWRPPDRFNPWATLDLRAEPDPFLHYKLARLGGDTAACRAVLAQAGARFTSVPDRVEPSGCGWTGAVRLLGTGEANLSSPAILSCPLAASLVMWDRNVLQPQAVASFGQHATVIDHVGSYACRNIYHREDGPVSHHATADALDVTGIRLAQGQRLTVARNWDDTPFMRVLHDGGCRYFGMFFGPDYNAAHRDHFHVQGGGSGYCR